MNQPIFVYLSGHTARVDPQRTPTSYVRLSILTEQAYDDAGNIAYRGQAVEIYITADQADQLAEALRNGRHHEA